MLTTIYDVNSKDISIYNNEMFDKCSYVSCFRNYEGWYYIKCVNYDILSEEDKLRCFNVMRLHGCGMSCTWKIKQREAKDKEDQYISKIFFPSLSTNYERKEYLFADFDSTKDKFIRVLG